MPYRPTAGTPTLALVKIYTRSGDDGQTSLFGGRRVYKNNLRVAAYGDVDELNSALGAAVAVEPKELQAELLTSIQRDLFSIGGRLASPDPEKVSGALKKAVIEDERIAAIEAAIDGAESELPELRQFVLPGGTLKSALLHQARSVCRRAERSVVALSQTEAVPPVILAYLNRLSDLLFVLARLANRDANLQDRTW
jgi:cob(I)alamin adenosyltransferase